jgi:hypothetical protein
MCHKARTEVSIPHEPPGFDVETITRHAVIGGDQRSSFLKCQQAKTEAEIPSEPADTKMTPSWSLFCIGRCG